MAHKKKPYKEGLFRIVDKDTKEEIARNLTYDCAVRRCDEDFEIIEKQTEKLLTENKKVVY
jgi:hypothetical protein